MTEVLVVGGGGAGLTASCLLSALAVDHVLLNARPTTSQQPKAHTLNQRSMEILNDCGVADDVSDHSSPLENMRAIGWFAGGAGDTPNRGREILRMEFAGGGGSNPYYVAASQWLMRSLPQVHLEPLLRRRAVELAGEDAIRFGHELVGLRQDDDLVIATVIDHRDESSYEIAARYVIAADGGRTVGGLVGAELTGEREILELVSAWFSADLSDYLSDPSGIGDPELMMRWIIDTGAGTFTAGGLLITLGPTRFGPDSEEWVIHMPGVVSTGDAPDAEGVAQRVAELLGTPGLQPDIKNINIWRLESLVADRYRFGRVFLVGDGAHRHPPAGGLGLNSGIQDVHNLCWKLQAVLRGQADPALLESYEAERRPVALRNARRSMESFNALLNLDAAMGISPDDSPEANRAEFVALWEDSEEGEERRHDLQLASTTLIEFHQHDVEVGYRYAEGALIGAGVALESEDANVYVPSTEPGCHVPHAWLSRGGRRLALDDLIRPGRWLLIVGERGKAWKESALALADDLPVPLDVASIGHTDVPVDYVDWRHAWLRHRGISDAGAVLVRPDRFVAWRSHAEVSDPSQALRDAFAQLLAVEDAQADSLR